MTFIIIMRNIYTKLEIIKNGKDTSQQIKCSKCWMITINCFLQLSDDVGKKLSTHWFNSDPIENIFGTIRH